MIPKIIWQTYKDPFEKLPTYIKEKTQTWQYLNPEYNYIYMDDEQIRFFIFREFGKKWLNIFDSCPVGVMKSDIWRYLIVYTYGGVYVDIDTICNKKIEEWVVPGYNLIISKDDDDYFYNQISFASKPKHKLLKSVIDCVEDNFKEPNYKDIRFVDRITGVMAWTKGINNYLDNNKKNDIKIYSVDSIKYLGNNKASYYNDAFIHLTASLNWNKDYIGWQEQEKMVIDLNDL